ncbi:MAG TPA: Hsp70 family protein [Paracoccaceae bacterium]|nr:Hsp70 family protein [Paracoccaceae bacterium]
MRTVTLGVDFGTSNTAAAVFEDGCARIIPLETGQKTLPTAVFLDYAERRTLFGSDAVRAMIDGRYGRFMRSLKSILGTPLARERRQFLNERLTLLEIVARFLTEVRARAEAATGARIERVIAGRPVHFHSSDQGRDRQAEVDLAECYRMAGFADVRFLHEPEAAALAAGPGNGIGLIVDIGGGTSDFTLFRGHGRGMEIIGSHGVRIGGTDFDRALSLAHAMPLLGLGGELKNELGPGRNDVPPALFHELASWEKIAFVYGPEALRDARRMARLALAPDRLARLVTVLEMELGHDIAFAVEAAKIAANRDGQGEIRLDPVEKGLRPLIWQPELLSALWPQAARVGEAAKETLLRAGLGTDRVGRVIFVGGSSLVGVIDQLMRATFPAAQFEYAEVFTAVVDGLAIAAGQEA